MPSEIGHKTDVYSIGVLIFKNLTNFSIEAVDMKLFQEKLESLKIENKTKSTIL